MLQPMLYKSVVTIYRIFAILTLYVVLLGVLAYGFVMGFYALNSSWAAPVILSPTDDKSLDFTEKLVTSRQTLEDLNVDVRRLDGGVEEMNQHRDALSALEPELRAAITREKKHNLATGPQFGGTGQAETSRQPENASGHGANQRSGSRHRQGSIGRADHQRRRGYAACGGESGPELVHGQQDQRSPADRQRSRQNHDGDQVHGRARQAGRAGIGDCPARHCHWRGTKADSRRDATDRPAETGAHHGEAVALLPHRIRR